MKTSGFFHPQWAYVLAALALVLVSVLTANAQTAPAIFAGPFNRSVFMGSNVTLRVIATGSDPLLYQWQFNGTNLHDEAHISGSTTSALTISNAQTADAGPYSVIVSNSVGWVTSTNAQLMVISLTPEEALDTTNLVWQTDPNNPWTWENTTTHDGVDAAQSGSILGLPSYLQTTIDGPASVNFWWNAGLNAGDYMGLLVDSNEVTHITYWTSWESQSVYVPPGSHVVQWLFSRNQNNWITSAYVDQVTITAPTLPIINSTLGSQSVPPGTSLTLACSVSGMLPIAYQWQFNGTNLAGATDTELSLNNLQTNASGSYTLIASNGAGTVTSAPIILSVVTNPPTFTQEPQNQTAYYGISTSFSAAATGTPPLSYQWQFNGTNLAGATGTTLTITNPQPASAGSYQMVVSNAAAVITSAAATLTVLDPAPAVSPLPPSKTVFLGSSTYITSSATGYGLKYQWRLNGTNLVDGAFVSGATNGFLSLPKVRAYQAGSYSVIVSNAYGVVSSKCELSVQSAVAWGAGANPPYGDDPNFGQATIPAGLTGMIALSGGRYHSLALQSNGTVVAWGAGTNDMEVQPFYGQAILPNGLNDVKAIAAGGFHSLALKGDGTVVAWGAGTTQEQNTTVHSGQSQVPTNLNNVKAIAAGTYHSLALKRDGTVISWGLWTNVPPNLTNVMAIAAGFGHSLALLSNGTVVAWGNNDFSQTNVPSTLSNVVAVAAGDYHSLALKSDGTIVSWGKQVGNPSFTSGFVNIAAAGDHNIGIRTNSSVYTWGFAGNNLSMIPVATNVISVGAGYLHDLVLLGDGSPVLKYSPLSQSVFAGDNVTFNLLAVIPGPQFQMGYQWRFNGTNLPGKSGSALTLNKVQYTNAGSYVVVVTNLYGAITSAPAMLSVSIPVATTNLGLAVDATDLVWTTSGNAPWFGQSNMVHVVGTTAQSGAIGDNQQSSLMTTLIGPGKVSFWWQVSSEEYFDYLNFYVGGTLRSGISGLTGWKQDSFSIPPGPQTLEWRYVKDSSTSVGQDAGWLDQVIFIPAPTITSQPGSQSLMLGATAQFTVQATGSPPLTYRWTKGGVTISGATNATLTLTNVVRTNAANYAVAVSNSGGATTSSNATLTVQVPQQIGSPQPLTNGTFQLISGYADTWPLQPGDLMRFDALASTNLQDWILLTNVLSLTNGQLLLQDDDATNWPTRYYRIFEH